MSAPVKVLAVLDEAASWLSRTSEGPDSDARAEAVKQARAAVAELIDVSQLQVHYINRSWYVVYANHERTAWSNIKHATEQAACEEAGEALRASIARVGGAA